MNNTVGKKIEEVRIYAGLTRKDLAEQIYTQSNYISQIEEDEKVPSFKTIFEITKVLKVKPEELVEEDTLFIELSNLTGKHNLFQVIEYLQSLNKTKD